MIAKLIIHADNREQALARCRRALDEFIIQGVHTTIPFTQFILGSKDFVSGNYDTGFIEKVMKTGYFSELSGKPSVKGGTKG